MFFAKTPDTAPDLNLPPRPRHLSWLRFGAIAVLLSAGGSIAVGAWLGLTLLLDPNSLLWLNRFLPEWSQVPLALTNPVQTLGEIEQELALQQRTLGAEIRSGDAAILPVWQTPSNCAGDNCEAIAALRVYYLVEEEGATKYSLLNELSLGQVGTLETFTELKLLPRPNDAGQWLSLEGTRKGSDIATGNRYGLVLWYNPQLRQLQTLLPWQNPAGHSPTWQQVVGDLAPELLIDQSQNQEPEFSVYRVLDGKPQRQLVPVSLENPALDLPIYAQAIALARLKLWAIAAQQLTEIRQTIDADQWTAAADEQFQFIDYHGELIQEKCEATTLNIGQKIKHCLRAGDVNEALRLLQNNIDDPLVVMAVVSFLESSHQDLGDRLDALHGLDPFRESVTLWQFLTLTAKNGSQGAIAALREQQQIDPKLETKIRDLLGQVENTLSQQSRPLNANSKVMGELRRTWNIRPDDWLKPEGSAIALDRNQAWHILEVTRYFDGEQWQQTPFNLELSNFVPGQSLWQLLGLELDDRIYIGTADLAQPTNQFFGQVRGAKLDNGKLQLLVQGQQPLQNPTFAYSNKTVRWLTPNTMSIQALAQIEPAWVDEMLVNLWRHLRASDLRFEVNVPDSETLRQEFGAWQIQPIELTGNNHSEARLTLYLNGKRKLTLPDVITANNAQLTPYNLIFGDTGELLYSELSQPGGNKLGAIADLQDGGVAALVMKDKNNQFTFQRWDSSRRDFQAF